MNTAFPYFTEEDNELTDSEFFRLVFDRLAEDQKTMNTKSKHYDDDGRLQASASTIRMTVKLTNTRNGKTCSVVARPPWRVDGQWCISERQRTDAWKKLGADTDDTNAGVVSYGQPLRVTDANGWHTFTIWEKA